MKNVYLIGVPGCGKSHIGQMLSRKLGRTFVDTDDLIEKKTGKRVSILFQEEGEEAFRTLETDIIKELSQKKNLIVATGGGIVEKPENVDLMRSEGLVIWLRRDRDKVLSSHRLLERPLLKDGPDAFLALADKREPLYKEACHDMVHNNDNRLECLKDITRIINTRGK